MEDDKLYPDQTGEQTADQETGADHIQKEEDAAASTASGLRPEDPIQDVRFTEQPDTAAAHEDHNEPYQNETPQYNEVYRKDTPYQSADRQNGAPYQDSGYQNNTPYQDSNYQNDRPYQGGVYQNNADQYNPYYDNYRNAGTGYQNTSCYNGAYSGTGSQNYGSDGRQYSGAQPYQNVYQNTFRNDGQMELEEPVKISEWVLAMVLMMIPCVNIIMMFVWAFSSTEKKSKSNFFKAYLIFFGISMGVMLFVWIAIVFFAMLV